MGKGEEGNIMPIAKLLTRTDKYVYVGNYVPYPISNKGCAFIVKVSALPRIAMGSCIMEWPSVEESEGWGKMEAWVAEHVKQDK